MNETEVTDVSNVVVNQPALARESLLRRTRRLHQLGLESVAAMVGISSSNLSRIENGQQNPSRAVAVQLRNLYGLDLEIIFENPVV